MKRAKKKITKKLVDGLKPDNTIWDTGIRGFGVRCQKRDKVYVLKLSFQGRQRWISIGKHGSPWTVEKARNEALRLLGIAASGTDPAEARDEIKNDLTISELCDLYISEGCATKKPSTLATDRGRIERHIKPLLGKKHCRNITQTDVERMMRDIAKGKTAANIKTGFRGRAIVKGGKGTATKAVTLLGAMFTFAVNRGLRPDNPVRGIKKYASNKHERFLSPAELGQLGMALSEGEKNGVNPTAINAIRLLIMTGCRKSEVLNLQWQNVDFERSCFRLPDSKTGAKIVPIGAAVLKLLEGLPRIKDNPYVLPGEKPESHFVGLPRVWEKIRANAELDNVRLHDLRHSFASVGAAGGDSLLMIGKLLGHRDSSTTARYAHLADDPLRATADRISNKIAAAMKTDTVGAEIVELAGTRKPTNL